MFRAEVTSVIAATPILKRLDAAVVGIAHIAPIASRDCVWNGMSTAHTPEDEDDSPWQSLDPRLNCLLGSDIPPETLDKLIVVGPYGLCQAVKFFVDITVIYADCPYPVTPALYEGKVNRLIEAIERRYDFRIHFIDHLLEYSTGHFPIVQPRQFILPRQRKRHSRQFRLPRRRKRHRLFGAPLE